MTERETPDQPATTPEEAPQAPTAPGNLDAMPHLHRRAGDNALLDEEGNLIPPGHESGRSGSADVTWESGKPQPAPGGEQDQ